MNGDIGDIGPKGPIGLLSNNSTSYFVYLTSDEEENLVKIEHPDWSGHMYVSRYVSRDFYLAKDITKVPNKMS